ncbi:hypothetical protein D3C87_1210030 [compost metagenome]
MVTETAPLRAPTGTRTRIADFVGVPITEAVIWLWNCTTIGPGRSSPSPKIWISSPTEPSSGLSPETKCPL